MTEDLTHILIFKTNINTFSEVLRVQQLFSANPDVQDWNVDVEDVDKVLRIVSCVLSADEIIRLLQTLGFECSELE